MTYVYILRSLEQVERYYVGIAADLRARLKKHDAREVSHPSKYAPWALKTHVAFHGEKASVLPSRSISSRLQQGHLPRSGSQKREGQACAFAARRQRAESVDISDTYARLRYCGKLDTI